MEQPSPQPMDQDAEIARFSDEDDARLFESCGDARRLVEELVGEILRIKRNDPTVNILDIEYDMILDDAASRRLGDILGQSTHLEELRLQMCDVDAEAMFTGLQRNQSIKKIRLLEVDLQKMIILAPFLTHNQNLKEIFLIDCRIEQASIDILANTLSNGTGNILESLSLSGNPIGGTDLDGFLEALNECSRLRILRLSFCGIGPRACASLSALLENSDSNLAELDLARNSINNESAATLVSSLVFNKNLQVLHLGGNHRIQNNPIQAEGWLAMLQLVCNSTSVKGVVNSNHVLRFLGRPHMKLGLGGRREIIGPWGDSLRDDDVNLLRASLRLNEGENKLSITRRKIIWSHARGDLNLGELPVAAGTMPRILAWFGGGSNESDDETIQYHKPPLQEPEIGIRRLGGVYHILLSMPDLCNRERDVPGQGELHSSGE